MRTTQGVAPRWDLRSFGLAEMVACTARMRRLGADGLGRQAVAHGIVHMLYEGLARSPNESACALVRCFATVPFARLDRASQRLVRSEMTVEPPSGMRCLTLLATAGDEPSWNDPHFSASHRVIPMPSPDVVSRSPMIAALFAQLGLELDTVLGASNAPAPDLRTRPHDVFFVEDARGSPSVPDQDGFVVPYGIRSVLGFGGVLPGNDVFAVILFTKVHVGRSIADLFGTVALAAKVALLSASEPDANATPPPP